jgi:phage protein U
VLAKIDEFSFEMNKTTFDQFQNSLKFDFAKQSSLVGFSSYQAIGKWSQSLNLSGIAFLNNNAIDDIENIAKLKKPVLLTTPKHMFNIIILDIQETQKDFYIDGTFFELGYTIKLERVFDEE